MDYFLIWIFSTAITERWKKEALIMHAILHMVQTSKLERQIGLAVGSLFKDQAVCCLRCSIHKPFGECICNAGVASVGLCTCYGATTSKLPGWGWWEWLDCSIWREPHWLHFISGKSKMQTGTYFKVQACTLPVLRQRLWISFPIPTPSATLRPLNAKQPKPKYR